MNLLMIIAKSSLEIFKKKKNIAFLCGAARSREDFAL
jgi:hypothetical protein